MKNYVKFIQNLNLCFENVLVFIDIFYRYH